MGKGPVVNSHLQGGKENFARGESEKVGFDTPERTPGGQFIGTGPLTVLSFN